MATTSTTNAPLPWMEQYMRDFASRSQQVANTPYQQGPGTYAAPNNLLQSGWQATANRAAQGSPVMSAANTQLTDTINGGKINQNPYLDQSIQNAQGDLTRSYNMVNKPAWDKAMQGSGSFGNTGVMEAAGYDRQNLANSLGKVSTDMRNNAYNTDRAQQMQAMSMAPQYANQDYQDTNQLLNAGAQQQTFNSGYQAQQNQFFQDARNYPQQQLANYGNNLGFSNSGGTSSQSTQDPSLLNQIIGGASTGLGLYNGIKSIWGG
ncbi:MAG: hypothetical protein Q7T97_02510 [Burkholderiaceae bacterium]|nr:hypothetical protein [Burkholderiaceae bacterium]